MLPPVHWLLLASKVEEEKPERVAQANSPPVHWRACWVLALQVVRPAPWMLAEKRLELDAVVAKKLVEVELLEVELIPVKFWRVVEERARSCWKEDTAVEVVAVKNPASDSPATEK